MANDGVKFIIKAVDKASSEINKSTTAFGKLNAGFKALTGMSLGAAGAIGAVYKGLQWAVNGAIEVEQATAKLNAVLKSTGGVSGMTTESLDGLADSLEKVTAFDAETIKSGEALMLTFTKVGRDVFPQAMEAALNMSTAFGQDLQGSVIQLGKALNDPNGMAAMKRIGVSFTDAQMEMGRELFATGKIAEYQKLIMSELNTEVGGMARAMGTTYAGQVAILENNLGQLGDTVGGFLIHWLSGAAAGANILFTKIDMLQESSGKWGNQLREQGSTYDDYVRKIIANADAVGALHYSQDAYLRMIESGKDLPGELAEKIGLLSEREYGLLLFQDDLSGGTESVAKQMGHLGVEVDDLNADLSSSGGLVGALDKTTMYFKALTEEMLFNLAAEGLDAESALALAGAMGLVDSAALAEIEAVQKLRAEFEDTGNLDTFIGKMGSLANMLEYINSMSNVNINFSGSGYGGYGTSDTQYNQAVGGGVDAGVPLKVGDGGQAEVFVPNQDGNIIPGKAVVGGITKDEMMSVQRQSNRELAVMISSEIQKALG